MLIIEKLSLIREVEILRELTNNYKDTLEPKNSLRMLVKKNYSAYLLHSNAQGKHL